MENELQLIPKYDKYMEYMINLLLKLPRTEKFSIGTEYKASMYQTIDSILYIQKIEKSRKLYYLNIIDAKLNCQRIYLRIMKNNRWIDEKKYKTAFEMLLEIGKILGGLIKYYAKDTKK